MAYNSVNKPMKPKIKALWLEALKSGDYSKGIGRLRDEDNNFCCLGVLCNLHAQAHPRIAKMQKNPEEYLGSGFALSPIVMKWAGIVDSMGRFMDVEKDWSLPGNLAGINDQSTTFKSVIRAIEKHF